MRPIKFRWQHIDSKEWVYWYLVQHLNPHKVENEYTESMYIYSWVPFWQCFIEVIPETVWEYTWLLDKNGKEIYEGDIIAWKNNAFGSEYQIDPARVDWNGEQCGYTLWWYYGNPLSQFYDLEVIWNIYEKPEILNSNQS